MDNKLELKHTSDEFLLKINGVEIRGVKDYTLKSSAQELTELSLDLFFQPENISVNIEHRDADKR